MTAKITATVDLPEVTEMRNLRVKEAESIAGLGRTKLYEEMAAGRLRSVKIGGARRIPLVALREFLAAQDGRGV